jgi:hypothetical protein
MNIIVVAQTAKMHLFLAIKRAGTQGKDPPKKK